MSAQQEDEELQPVAEEQGMEAKAEEDQAFLDEEESAQPGTPQAKRARSTEVKSAKE